MLDRLAPLLAFDFGFGGEGSLDDGRPLKAWRIRGERRVLVFLAQNESGYSENSILSHSTSQDERVRFRSLGFQYLTI